MSSTAHRVASLRAFNRLYTGVIGVLDEGPADAEYSLSEARVIFELAQREVTQVADLRRRLDLDAGYASRLLARLEERGLVARERSDQDARRQVIRLTEAGERAFTVLDGRSAARIGSLLDRFDDDEQEQLLDAMGAISSLIGERPHGSTLVLRPPRPGDFGWIVHRHGVLYAREHGWDERFEAFVARVVADYIDHRDDPRQAAWIAELDGKRVGSVLCAPSEDPHTAKLRLLLLEPAARGHGVGTRLVGECLTFARATGYRAVELWTVPLLAAARAVYRKVGFQLVREEAGPDFGGEPLTGQTWRVEL